MVTLESFRVFFPEFVDATDELIEAHLADAIAITKPDVFPGELCDIVTKWRTADSLASSPWGRHARLVGDTSKTVYAQKVEEYIKMAPIAGPYVPGACGGYGGPRDIGIGLETGDY